MERESGRAAPPALSWSCGRSAWTSELFAHAAAAASAVSPHAAKNPPAPSHASPCRHPASGLKAGVEK
eukprot:875234-Rhodomonas_salina.1